jgi:hypothetical protein
VGHTGGAWAVVPSEQLLPSTTKGFVAAPDIDLVRSKFNETQLGALVHDPVMQPFLEDLKRQIGQKLEQAGKRLGVRWEDLEGVYGGEVALALVQPNPQDKNSHATVLIVDITGKRPQADALLAKIDANQRSAKAVRSSQKEAGVEITVYTRPATEDPKATTAAYYILSGDQLVACDDLATIKGVIHRLGGKGNDSLASVAAFSETMQRCAAGSTTAYHVRWFVEPFGYAEAARAAQGGRRKRGTDLLKILPSQGFNAIQGIGGHISFATDQTELVHRTYVYAPPVVRKPGDKNHDKYNLAMRMLDFPNSPAADGLEPPPWVLPDIASYLSFHWRMKEAFNYSETLVDAIIGDKGAFQEIWLSLKTDVNGPQIDIYSGLLDHLGTRATLLSDVRVPVDLKSERLMALVELTNPEAVAATVEKAFKKDPAAKRRVFRDQTIWEIVQDEGLAEEAELMIEGAGFVSTTDTAKPRPEEEEAKRLPNMAITVFAGHLIVATHVDFVQDLIVYAQQQAAGQTLAQRADYQRVRQALTRLGAGHDSFRFFTRTDESYRATYELVRQGKLPESETMLARLLNALLGPVEEGTVRKQEIDGSKLPEFPLVQKYLGPAGLFVQSEENGWWIVGCLLRKEP